MKSWKKMNKTMAIKEHLEERGYITSWEAIHNYGATRLSAIIYNLRHNYGLNIVSENVSFKDRYGNNADYVKYVLVKDGEE